MTSAHKGFTLVELLVVISIIAILSVAGIAVFTGVQKSARDSRRKADINAIAKAYETKYDGVYNTLSPDDFASGIFPSSPDSKAYTTILNSDNTGFQVCASLEDNPNNTCREPSNTCYCRRSGQGAFVLPIIVSDNFDRDNSLSLGLTDTGQSWLTTGSWGVINNSAYNVYGAEWIIALVNSGVVDSIVSADITYSYGKAPVLIFRGVNSESFLTFGIWSGDLRIQKVTNTTGLTTLASASFSANSGQTYAMKVVTNGNEVAAYVDEIQQITYTLTGSDAATYNSGNATHVGFGQYWNAGAGLRWDNLVVR